MDVSRWQYLLSRGQYLLSRGQVQVAVLSRHLGGRGHVNEGPLSLTTLSGPCFLSDDPGWALPLLN